MQLLYKVRYLPGMSIYLPKFFSAIQQIKDLVIIFITFTFSFLFSYTILSVVDFKMGALEDIKNINNDDVNASSKTILAIVAPIFGVIS